jgi:hypothetical protein
VTLPDRLSRTMNCSALGRQLLADRSGGPGPSDRPRPDDDRGHQTVRRDNRRPRNDEVIRCPGGRDRRCGDAAHARACGALARGELNASISKPCLSTVVSNAVTLGPVTETGLCKEMTLLPKEPVENRHAGRPPSPATKTIYLFRCGDSGLYGLTADSSGSTLPFQLYPQIRWRFERLVTVRTDGNSLKQKIVQAILDTIAEEGFKLFHASVSPELCATL